MTRSWWIRMLKRMMIYRVYSAMEWKGYPKDSIGFRIFNEEIIRINKELNVTWVDMQIPDNFAAWLDRGE